MTVRVYYSTDASAPTLSGSVGTLISVLDACLVNGYGEKSGAGWTKPYSGTNLAMYLQGTGGNGHILYVDDTGTTNGRGFGVESATGIAAYTNPFPTAAQFASGLYFPKSDTASAAARAWVIVATERCFYMYVGVSENTLFGAGTQYRPIVFFGTFDSYKAGDAFHTKIIGNTSSTVSYGGLSGVSGFSTAAPGHYIARSYTQIGTSITSSQTCGDSGVGSSGTSGAQLIYPDPVSGGIILTPLFVNEPAAPVRRGKLPGCFYLLNTMPGNCGDTFSGSGDLSGKTFLLLNSSNASSAAGRVALEISDTW